MTEFEQQIHGKKAEATTYRDRELEAMKHILATRSGRRVIYSLLGVCHFGRSAFGGTNEVTNMLAGKQVVGEHIIGLLNMTNPEAYSLMVKEAKEDEDHDRRTSSDQRNDANSGTAYGYASTSSDQPT